MESEYTTKLSFSPSDNDSLDEEDEYQLELQEDERQHRGTDDLEIEVGERKGKHVKGRTSSSTVDASSVVISQSCSPSPIYGPHDKIIKVEEPQVQGEEEDQTQHGPSNADDDDEDCKHGQRRERVKGVVKACKDNRPGSPSSSSILVSDTSATGRRGSGNRPVRDTPKTFRYLSPCDRGHRYHDLDAEPTKNNSKDEAVHNFQDDLLFMAGITAHPRRFGSERHVDRSDVRGPNADSSPRSNHVGDPRGIKRRRESPHSNDNHDNRYYQSRTDHLNNENEGALGRNGLFTERFLRTSDLIKNSSNTTLNRFTRDENTSRRSSGYQQREPSSINCSQYANSFAEPSASLLPHLEQQRLDLMLPLDPPFSSSMGYTISPNVLIQFAAWEVDSLSKQLLDERQLRWRTEEQLDITQRQLSHLTRGYKELQMRSERAQRQIKDKGGA
ncbi:hypothetical protein BC939DRAFT_488733 [Gamsiella multidivaricata]|uniref:uncharacterized protein n=1 Tax=Gamsiella multidivaricata TaxID=101098 RepID=UPI00221E6B01|nr:uncharacterized protein BC939DRAFT_488733 [Gamsiella multidivaricata]KAG0370601.1 hypothetical protein BGZ54_005506 [Gamsiella multidivaricata]KAI7832213.1 hypothetical protein BC939DRAFT_488733 [Gamsiella multidivaricata]